MQSPLFRLIGLLIPPLLLAGLIFVTVMVLRAPGASVATLDQESVHTQASITAMGDGGPLLAPTNRAANLYRVDAGGFAFQPLMGYTYTTTADSAVFTPQPELATGTVFVLRGGSLAQLMTDIGITPSQATEEMTRATPGEMAAPTAGQTSDLATIFTEFVTFYAQQDNFQSSNRHTTTIANVSGLAMDLTSRDRANGFVGRIAMVQPYADQVFVLIGVAAAAEWQATAAAAFDQLRMTITFFPLPVPLAAAAALRATATATTAVTGTATPIATKSPTPPRTPRSPVLLQATATHTPATALVATPDWQQAPTPGLQLYSNGNSVNDLLVQESTIWAATEGGVSRWSRSNNSFVKYSTLDGLAANRTTTVVNCPLRGFGVVFGTDAGLQIFDAQQGEWKVLNSSNSDMHFDDVATLTCSTEFGFLIVGYRQHGLDIFDAKREDWTLVDQRQGLPNNIVEAVTVVGDREQIWVSSGFGLTTLTASRVLFYDRNNTPLDTNQIQVMVSDTNGAIWLGAGNKVYKIDDDLWTIYSQSYVLASPFPSGEIVGLAPRPDGTVWIASRTGEVCHLNPQTVNCDQFFTPDDIGLTGALTKLTLDDLGRVYLATAQVGVRMYDGTSWRAFAAPNEVLAGNQIYALAQDQQGFIWVATNGGLQQINPVDITQAQLFTPANSPFPVDAIKVLLPAATGGVWLGGEGAAYFDGHTWANYTANSGVASSGLVADSVQAIAIDTQARAWFGTHAGLSIWNGDSFFNLTRADRLPSENITALLVDGSTVWIGSDAGLLRYEKGQFQLFTTSNLALPSEQITALALGPDGTLWIGTKEGLASWQDNQLTVVDVTQGEPITAIATTATGEIWVGTDQRGLHYFDGRNWVAPPAEIRPQARAISALLVDRQGTLWIGSTTGGLLRYMY
ncbi:MAG: two-component regulator propeller domain-containing protein [Caldilineaceae bacterium]